jgi:hypothetical protein
MPRSDPDPAGRPRSLRRRLSVPLSVALHAAVFYAIGLVPWAASEIPERPVSQRQVVWLEQSPAPLPERRAVDPSEASATSEPTVPAVEPEKRTANVVPAPPASPPVERRPTPPVVEPSARPTAPTAPVRAAEDRADVRAAEPAAAPPVPDVDWEKERHDAVRDVLEQRATQREYLTFSLDDLIEEPEPADPVPLPLVVDNCVIVKGKLQRFAALMMGRCVREARSDLFAAIKPAYLKAHPVCIETRPDNPGSFLSDGRQISTVKCELVANEE